MPDMDVRNSQTPVFWRPQRPRLAGGPVAWLLMLTVLVVGLLSMFGENGLGAYFRLRNQRDQLQADHRSLELNTAQIEGRLEALRTDPEALEALARERYNMRREGEQVIRLVPADDESKSP